MDTRIRKTIAEEAAEYRPLLYRMALTQLRNTAAAEDATQETLLAAIEKAESFERRSSLRTWLFSILRFKILDVMRDQSKARRRDSELPVEHSVSDDYDVGTFDTLFDESGCWVDAKDVWTNPYTVAERDAFFRVLEACMTRLPARTSRAFLMREWLELDPPEICRELEISHGNLRILLYRARMQLRLCLDLHWERD
ncbi:RNA polymerase sigma factor [Hyphomicrobium denitrificans 1NES1]|uniref:RNA polymerase sigma factor n=1 Tax=Hyphomicrobium denitrificans 1NES1 TaxID=670307 RepID=N0B3C1_9HYPH|nr:sigma-70 family RNA polymerase sigma factor [Hyphomicrobium denitrificans]AGK56717.1 RNA polymerase sigma factor [Hyphomicrobium denitrificans 1NES1]